MNTFFSKSDFKVCSLPLPSNYPRSQTHVGVAFHEGRLLMTASPYPNINRTFIYRLIRILIYKLSKGKLFKDIPGEIYENPFLYIAEDDYPPQHFLLLCPNPLMDTPIGKYGYPAYNSDPDIFVENDTIYVLNRVINRKKDFGADVANNYEVCVYLISGQLKNNCYSLSNITVFKENCEFMVSPCITKFNEEYIYMTLNTNSYNDGGGDCKLKFQRSDSIYGLKNCEDWHTVEIQSDGFIPWHMSLFQHENVLYAIIACIKKGQPKRCWQMLGRFNSSLSVLTIFQMPLTSMKSYRGAAFVDKNGLFVLYSTTVGERINGGRSVDGREVVLTTSQFSSLLNTIQ